MTTGTLVLDESSIRPEALSLSALMRELTLQHKPSWLLVKLMNALEKKRQARGLGWSRAWNKYGLTVFRTHVQRLDEDADYFHPLLPVLNHFLADTSTRYRNFVSDLLNDPERMAFTFYHNNSTESGTQYEGLTLSLGRRVAADRTKRDRLDIVIEDKREGGRVDGAVDRLRIYVCPWETYQEGRTFHLAERTGLNPEEFALAQVLYESCIAKYHEWKADESRQWSHWSVRYIDYFGPRSFIPQGSAFI
jgi:hypothetical protein